MGNKSIKKKPENNKIDDNKLFSAVLPPKKSSVITERYLAINKFSNIDKKILIDVARILTSKEMQLLRATKFGSVPALDLTRKSDYDINSYCEEKYEICYSLEKMTRIRLKEIFKTKYQTPFFEVRLLLPSVIRNNLINGTVENITKGFINIKELNTTTMGIYFYLCYIVVSIFSLISLKYVYQTFKYRNHPYIKAVSPHFCNLMNIGFIMSMISLLMFLPPYSILKSKISYLYDMINISLIVIPMVFVTYRIYYIFKSESIVNRVFSNKRLSICIIIPLLIIIAFKIYIIIQKEFYYIPFGLLNENPRFPQYYFEDFRFFDDMDGYFILVLYIVIIIMIILTGKITKKFGNFSYIYAIAFKTIIDYFAGRILVRIRGDHFKELFFAYLVFYNIICFLCIYILVGSRIRYIVNYPTSFDASNNSSNKVISTRDLMDFVSLKKNKEQYLDLMEEVNQNRKANASNYLNSYSTNAINYLYANTNNSIFNTMNHSNTLKYNNHSNSLKYNNNNHSYYGF